MGRLTAGFAPVPLLSALLTLTAVLSTGCSKSTTAIDDQKFPQTGSEFTEIQVATSQARIVEGAKGFISADSVRIRTSPDSSDNVAGRLFLNDEVQIISLTTVGTEEFVPVRIVTSNSSVDRSQTYYLAMRFLNDKPMKVDPAASSLAIAPGAGPSVAGQKPTQSGRLFIVTNIATERLRVYQRCLPNEGCVNRMILEAGVVNGEAKDGTRTDVGFFQVASWTKFYETPAYPAWYKPGYPAVPQPGNRSAWINSEYMPNGKGDMRGAFGWYTAKVSPNPNGQWTHGTAGWGADKTDFITFKDSFWGKVVNIFTSIRSHGCTRIDNESIAYIRQLIAVGTPLVKIYAREGYRDESRTMYNKVPGRWEYIMTKNGHQAINNHQLADRATVLGQGTPQSEWIDQGTYQVDQFPDAEDQDLYSLGSSAFQGVFLVDEGTLLNYKNPTGIARGGYSDQIAPPYMFTTNPAVTAPRATTRPTYNRGHNDYENAGG